MKSLLFFTFLWMCIPVFSQQKEIQLWDKIPNSIANKNYTEAYTHYGNNEINGASKVSTPTLTVFWQIQINQTALQLLFVQQADIHI